MNYFCLSAAREICPSPLSAEAWLALFESLTCLSSSPPLLNHSLWQELIFDNKPRSNLSCGPTSSTLHVCGLGLEWRWKCRAMRGEIRSSQRALIHTASGNVVFYWKAFSFCCRIGVPKSPMSDCLSVSQSVTRRVITEECWWIFILLLECCGFRHSNLGLGRRISMWFVLENEIAPFIKVISDSAIIYW